MSPEKKKRVPISEKVFAKALIKHDGSSTQAARALGITRQVVNKRLRRNPGLQKKILSVREEALKSAGITRSKVYRIIAEGLRAKLIRTVDGIPSESKLPDYTERRENVKICLSLFGDMRTDDAEGTVSNVGMMIFNIVNNQERKVIDVL